MKLADTGSFPHCLCLSMLCRVFSKFLRGIFDWKSACDFNFFILSSLCIPVGDEELTPVG